MTDCADVSVMQAENESLKAAVLAQNTELLELRRLAAPRMPRYVTVRVMTLTMIHLVTQLHVFRTNMSF